MTIEEQLAKLQDEFEAVKANNKELIAEKRKLQQKLGEIDFNEYNKALSERDEYKDKFTKLSKDLDTKNKEFESLSNALSEKNKYLSDLTLENALNEHLGKLNLRPSAIRGQKALLKAEAEITDNGVLIGGKPISDYLSEWINTDEGKDSVLAPANGGSSATGSTASHSESNLKRSAMTHAEKGEYIKANGQEAYLKLPN